MKRHRTTILIMGSLMAFGAVSSDAALAGSLLSGYGGPGQGNQAILGSALLNRPGGGSGSNGASTSTSQGSSTSATGGGEAASNGSGSAGRSATSGKPRSSHVRGGANAAPRGARSDHSGTKSPSIADVYAAAERGRPAPSAGALGLSGADVLLILLMLGILALIGALSWRLARSRPGRGPQPESGG